MIHFIYKVNLITEFFNKYPILGIKSLDYQDFCKVVRLMQNQAHLSKIGVDEIISIKRGMNKGRRTVAVSAILQKNLNIKSKIPSYQINKVRYYTSLVVNQTEVLGMNPWFITGFSDGEACFSVNIYKSKKHILGWGSRASFEIGLNNKDLFILNHIKSYFGIGNCILKADGSCVYYVQSIKDLAVIINHFDKYPLITQKRADYLLFKMAVNLIKNKEHLTMEGLRKIVSIRASIYWGLPL